MSGRADDLEGTAPALGRRERKKQETRIALRRAALRLALERGVDQLTIEEISEAADVAPRTFFNYFACKEDALVGENLEVGAHLREAVAARPPSESPFQVIHAVLHDVVVARLADEAYRQEALLRQQLVREHPSLLPRQLARFAAFEEAICAALAERLGADPQRDLRPALTAALAGTVMRVVIQRWTGGDTDSPGQLLDDAFQLLEAGS